MKQYLDLLNDVLENGIERRDRTGTGTTSVFGRQLRFNLQEGFPLLTTKKMPFKSIASELLWFLEGSTDERRLAEILYEKPREDLQDKKTIWTANAEDPNWTESRYPGDLGRIYGKQWREWRSGYEETTDQIQELIRSLVRVPYSRRHLVVAYNPGELDLMALPPCHVMFQFYVNDKRELSCMWTQRSVDIPLGLPFNIASYALLTHLVAQVCNMKPGDLIFNGGDCHIYLNQIEAVKEQLGRMPRKLPNLNLNPDITDIFKFTLGDMSVEDYHPYDKIDIPFSV